jgi:hypothetical protein
VCRIIADPDAGTYGNGRGEMCVLLSTYQPRVDAESMIAAAEGCDGPAATGVMPAGVRV